MNGMKKTIVYVETRGDLSDTGVAQSMEYIQSKEGSDHRITQLTASLYLSIQQGYLRNQIR